MGDFRKGRGLNLSTSGSGWGFIKGRGFSSLHFREGAWLQTCPIETVGLNVGVA